MAKMQLKVIVNDVHYMDGNGKNGKYDPFTAVTFVDMEDGGMIKLSFAGKADFKNGQQLSGECVVRGRLRGYETPLSVEQHSFVNQATK
jgi:hypothetical protein